MFNRYTITIILNRIITVIMVCGKAMPENFDSLKMQALGNAAPVLL